MEPSVSGQGDALEPSATPRVEPSVFARDTAVEPLGEGRYRAEVSDRWQVFGDAAPNGGYLLALGARAMANASSRPDPVTVTGHFLRPVRPGPVDIRTEVIKAGRQVSTVRARMFQDGQERLALLGSFGDLDQFDGPTRQDREPPSFPQPEDCLDLNAVREALPADAPVRPPPIVQRFAMLLAPDLAGWAVGQPSGRGEVGGWCRFANDEPMGTLGLLVVADAFPPAVFGTGLPMGWVPTVELTVHVRKRPVAGWLRAVFTTDSITAGLLEEDGEVWDAAGELVVLSRQLALAARR